MENLNAEQIKNVLEHCANWTAETGCKGCPYEDNCIDEDVTKDALDLITSQEQKIKELTEENERLNCEIANSVVAKQDENKYIAQIKQLSEEKRLSPEKEIIFINKVISEAVIHGADWGGSYNSNEEGLTEAINEWLEYKNLHHLYCVEIRDVHKIFGCRSEMWSVPQICEKTEIKEADK